MPSKDSKELRALLEKQRGLEHHFSKQLRAHKLEKGKDFPSIEALTNSIIDTTSLSKERASYIVASAYNTTLELVAMSLDATLLDQEAQPPVIKGQEKEH